MYRQNQSLTLVGKVAGVHGIRGELAVFPLTDSPERFFELDCVFIDTEDPAGGPPQPQEIEGVRIHKGRVLLKVASIQDRTAAERLVGHQVFIRSEDRKELEKDRFFVDQLVGLTVEDEDGKRLGTVQAMTEIPGGHLVVVHFERGQSIDIPFVKAYVASVDTELGRMVLKASYLGLLNPEEVR
jgi:16S rRNA processing protein RimM